jgi:hypothetical protein
MESNYTVAYDKDARRWGVYTDKDWVCDCIDKETAKKVAAALKYYDIESAHQGEPA